MLWLQRNLFIDLFYKSMDWFTHNCNTALKWLQNFKNIVTLNSDVAPLDHIISFWTVFLLGKYSLYNRPKSIPVALLSFTFIICMYYHNCCFPIVGWNTCKEINIGTWPQSWLNLLLVFALVSHGMIDLENTSGFVIYV